MAKKLRECDVSGCRKRKGVAGHYLLLEFEPLDGELSNMTDSDPELCPYHTQELHDVLKGIAKRYMGFRQSVGALA